MDSPGICTDCRRGKFSQPLRSSSCQDCPAGYFAASEGQQLCALSQAGYYVASRGSPTQSPCPRRILLFSAGSNIMQALSSWTRMSWRGAQPSYVCQGDLLRRMAVSVRSALRENFPTATETPAARHALQASFNTCLARKTAASARKARRRFLVPQRAMQ